jgi:hypothetical protein
MRAFVQVHSDGDFFSANFFDAWRAFNWFGYEVIKFKPFEIEDIPIACDTPVFGSVATTKRAFRRLNVIHEELPSYPDALSPYLGRVPIILQVKDVWQQVCAGKKWFVKPLDCDRKRFDGRLLETELDLIHLVNLPDDLMVYCCKPVNFLSEFRVFVLANEVVDVRKYRGDWKQNINSFIVESAIKDMVDPPKAYCLDFGVTDSGQTILVEVTDAWAFGHYGLDMTLFGNMILTRWEEIVGVINSG